MLLLYKPESTIGSSMIDLPVQLVVPKKKLTHVRVGCTDVMNKLEVPDC
jgi:hypothetical protein